MCSTPRSNRAAALEDEIDRLKAEQCAKVLELEEASKAWCAELGQSIETLQKKALRLQNQVFTLETTLHQAKEALKDNKRLWDDERAQLLDENSHLHEELAALRAASHSGSNADDHEIQQHEERNATELEQLRDEIADTCRREAEALKKAQIATDRATRLQCELEVHVEQLAQQHAAIEALRQQVARATEREDALALELVTLRDRNSDLQRSVSHLSLQLQSQHSTSVHPQQHADVVSRLYDAEQQRDALVRENHALRDQLARLQQQLSELSKATNASGSVFAVHVELKRENQQLRQQVDELKQLQRRFLTTAKKKTMSFPAI